MRWIFLFLSCAMACAKAEESGPAAKTDASVSDGASEASPDATDGGATCDPAADPCPPSQHCSPLLRECIDGCRADDGCATGKKCDVEDHECVTCLTNADCTGTQVCADGACVAMCSASSPCPGSASCCSSACIDVASSTTNCGGCGIACTIAHGKGVCASSKCAVGSCEAPFADCDKDPKTGCEIDTSSNLANCGGCGKACAPKNATGSCAGGACAIGSCAAGFGDCDKLASTGCEANLATDPLNCGACGSAPAETCNLQDDNCNGKCDDVDGCRNAVHRSVNSNEYFYTTSASEAACCGFTVEFSPYFYLYAAPATDAVPFYRCSGMQHFYTTSSSCEVLGASAMEGMMGYIGTKEKCGSVPLYRLAGPLGHLFTIDGAERASFIASGWIDEGIAGWVWTTPKG